MKSNLRLRIPICLSLLLAAFLLCAGCGKKPDVIGRWEGTMDAGPVLGIIGKPAETTFHLVLDIRKEDGQFKATMLYREIHREAAPVKAIEFKGGTLNITLDKQNDVYEGKLSPDGSIIRGSIRQSGFNTPVDFKRTAGT